MPQHSSIVHQWNAAHAQVTQALARGLAQCVVHIPSDATCPIRVEPVASSGDDVAHGPSGFDLPWRHGEAWSGRYDREAAKHRLPFNERAHAALYPYVGVSAIHGDVVLVGGPALAYFRTRTRFLGVVLHENDCGLGSIEHESRVEPVRGAGILVGADLTKEGTPVAVPGKACVRRIEAPAIDGAGWGVDVEAEAEVGADQLGELVRQMGDLVARSDNPTYREAWQACVARVDAGSAAFRIFRQHCGIKIGVHLATMDTTSRRVRYAELMRNANGAPERRNAFNKDHTHRWIVVEPYDAAKGGGYRVDDAGGVHPADAMAAPHHATAVYNKPVVDAEEHWVRISADEANKALEARGKCIPYVFIAQLICACEAVEAGK
jgi:hypothetical protein